MFAPVACVQARLQEQSNLINGFTNNPKPIRLGGFLYMGKIIMIKAILFDLDGTLVNSLEDLADSSNYALSKLGYEIHQTEKYKYFVGDGMMKLMERILPENKRTKENIDEIFQVFIDYYKEHFCDKTYAYKGIGELLINLKQEGFKIAVISNKIHNMTITVVERIFGHIFDCVFGKMEGYPPKPDAQLTNHLIEELGVKNNECVVVGDSGMDMAVARNAKCIGIGVLWGFRKKDELIDSGADFTAENTKDLYDIIKGLK